MKTPVLSVVIPVYNAQNTLPATLDSVLAQGIDGMEVLLVDDGSRDDSLAVCRQYASIDARIKVVSQQNAGPGAARNTALDIATGRYVAFIDSDDTVPSGAFANFLKAADGSDLVISHFNFLMNGKSVNRGLIMGNVVMDRAGFLNALSRRPGSYYFSALWNKLYVRAIIEENGIRFSKDLGWGEDFHFNMRYYRHVMVVSFMEEPVYNYYHHYTGQTWRTMPMIGRNILIKARLHRSLKELYLACGAYEQYRVYIHRYIFNVTLSK